MALYQALVVICFVLITVDVIATSSESGVSSETAEAPAVVVSNSLTKSWTLLHSVDEGRTFSPRGKLTLSFDDPTTALADEKNKDSSKRKDDSLLRLVLHNNDDAVSESMVREMLQTGWYQLQLVDQDATTASGAAPVVTTTVQGCQVRRANFRDELTVTLGPDATIYSIAYVPLVSPLAPPTCDNLPLLPEPRVTPASSSTKSDDDGTESAEEPTVASVKFVSRVSWETSVDGMVLSAELPRYQPPPGLRTLKGASLTPRTDGGEEAPPPPDNSPFSFIKRYWYILLPLFLSNFLTSDKPPPEQQRQQGQPQQGQPRPPAQQQQRVAASANSGQPAASASTGAAARPTAAASSSTSDGSPTNKVRARRGKRG